VGKKRGAYERYAGLERKPPPVFPFPFPSLFFRHALWTALVYTMRCGDRLMRKRTVRKKRGERRGKREKEERGKLTNGKN
jgi:hypothetical protein